MFIRLNCFFSTYAGLDAIRIRMPSITEVDIRTMLFLYKTGECFQPRHAELLCSFLAKINSINTMVKKEHENRFRVFVIFADFAPFHV